MGDYLTRDDLLLAGLSEDEADAVLRLSPLTGHGGQPVLEADRLEDLLAQLDDEDDDLLDLMPGEDDPA
jgi:hypothetical protein